MLCGCEKQSTRMEHPEDPQGRYSEQIAAAKRLLDQKENSANRAEWEALEIRGWLGSHRLASRVSQTQGTGAISALGLFDNST